jgi:uncharacterized membrane protein
VTALLSLSHFLALCGLVLAAVGGQIALDANHPRRVGSAAFWVLLAAMIGAGQLFPPALVGGGVLVLTLLVATNRVGLPQSEGVEGAALEQRAQRLGNRLLWPVLLVPAIAIAGGLLLPQLRIGGVAVVSAGQAAQVSLGLGCVAGLMAALRTTRERPAGAVQEGGRLLQLLGWTLILPQLLAGLGGIMGRAGVGDEIARLVAAALPVQLPVMAVVAYCAGMALFTILLGNAFAAFPIMTLGIGLPFIVEAHGGNPAIMGALGMLSGYCGTLVTPMAANFNLVPVRLLELDDDWAVIRAQAPFAAAIWIFNVVLMALCVYRF